MLEIVEMHQYYLDYFDLSYKAHFIGLTKI